MNEILIKLRKHLGLTQKAFAEKINTTRGALAQIESGNNNLSFALQHRINQIYQINLEDIEIKNGYLYNKLSNELLIVNEKIPTNISKSETYISDNDLAVINQKFASYPEIDVIKSYLHFSESRLKNILMTSKHNLKERLILNNNVCEIADILLLTKESYYKHRFEKITEKELIKSTLGNGDSSSAMFDNVKLKWISQIYKFESANEDLTFQGNIMIDYLKRGLEFKISVGFITLNKDLLDKISDL